MLLTPVVLTPLALIAAGCADQAPTALRPGSVQHDVTSAAPSAPGRYLVGLADGASLSGDVLAAAGASVVATMPALNVVEVVASNPSALSGSAIRYVERSTEFLLDVQAGDGVETPSVSGGGPDASTAPWYASGVQWDMKAMKLSSAVWAGSAGGRGVEVCIIDSGIDTQHQELTGKVDADTSFVATATVASPAALDSVGHGSHVASTVTGNGIVMASVAPAARLMAAKVFAATGGTPVSRVVNAITWCSDRGAHVINMSLGGIRYFDAGTDPVSLSDVQSYAAAVKYATDRGVVVVTSAGNSNVKLQSGATAQQLTVPAQVPGTVIVGATGPLSKVGRWNVNGSLQTLPFAPPAWNPFDAQQVWQGVDGRAFYSNWGPYVDVFAPGGRGGVPMGYKYRIVADNSGTRVQQVGGINDNVWAACSRWGGFTGAPNAGGAPGATGSCAGTSDRYASLAGTSMAAPHVAGLAALLYGELGAARSAENRTKVMNCLKSTADNIGASTTFGGGRVNAQAALACIRGGSSA